MYKEYIKRMLDFITALLAMPFVVCICFVIYILIKNDDGGPLFYNAHRIGKNGKLFTMYKLRSMAINAPDIRNSDGTTYNSNDDLRVTRIGKILRKTSLDEIVQLINVLKGDMSLIGPRPDMPDAFNIYYKNELLKLAVRPGITGYSQAYHRNTIEIHERFKEDLYYVNNISFIFDCKILLKTVYTVFLGKNLFRN